MQYKSHIVGGTLLAVGFSVLNIKTGKHIDINGYYYITSAVFGSLLPDIDHPNSFCGSEFKSLASALKHRTITHSLFFSVVIGLVGMLFNINIGIGLFLGILSHIILDMIDINSYGVSLFAPMNYNRIGINNIINHTKF